MGSETGWEAQMSSVKILDLDGYHGPASTCRILMVWQTAFKAHCLILCCMLYAVCWMLAMSKCRDAANGHLTSSVPKVQSQQVPRLP